MVKIIFKLQAIVFISLFTFFFSCKSPAKKQGQIETTAAIDKKWWKEAVVYQVYPRSFKDSDGDGVGDLKGIISRLDYIKSLGIDAVWLNPIYTSPNDDNGYDISDYRSIMKDFGTMEDFDTLLKGLHDRNIKLIMDLVVNHSSDEHEWFKQSRNSRNSPYRNYYHWWNAERGKPAYRWSFFDVNSEAWKYDSLTNAWYLHYFSRKQPDLNWENPQLRKEIYAIMKFWLDKGIDGFRMDAFQFASKDTTFPALPAGYEKNVIKYYGMGPHLHDYLQEMHREVFSRHDIMTVAEGAGSSFEDAHALVDPERNELDMAYHFEGIDYGNFDPDYDLVGFKKIYSRWDSAFASKGWLAIYLANHDQPRMVSHWGNDDPLYREASSKMLTTFVLGMRGTPYYYYGDELGMSNIKFTNIGDYRDIATLNKYKKLKSEGGDLKQFIEAQKRASRDNGRTPLQWNDSSNAGFTTGNPWIKVNPDYQKVNVAVQEKDTNSVLHYFRKMVKLRKENPVLIYGKYTLLDENNPEVYAFTRELDGKKVLVLLNFKSNIATPATGLDIGKAKILVSNYKSHLPGKLQPYEAIIYEL